MRVVYGAGVKMVRVEDDVYAALTTRAARDRRSVQATVAVLLENALRRDGAATVNHEVARSASTGQGAEPAPPAGSPGGGDESTTSESAPAASAGGKPRSRRPASGMCEHRVPAGTFCKLCGA